MGVEGFRAALHPARREGPADTAGTKSKARRKAEGGRCRGKLGRGGRGRTRRRRVLDYGQNETSRRIPQPASTTLSKQLSSAGLLSFEMTRPRTSLLSNSKSSAAPHELSYSITSTPRAEDSMILVLVRICVW